MDYIKKLEEAKRLYESANADQKYVLESLFPEIRESDDERIRREIIKFLELPHPQFVGKRHQEDWLAWLEKQGDSPIKWNKNTKDCKPKVSHSVLMKTTHGIAEGEWQGEHWHQYRWAALVRDTDVLSWIELSDLEKRTYEQ